MGQKQLKQRLFYSRRQLNEAVDTILQHTGVIFVTSKVRKPIRIILDELIQSPPFSNTQKGFHISKLILKIFANKKYPQSVLKLVKLFVDKTTYIMGASNLFFIEIDEWQDLVAISKIIVVLTDNLMIKMLNGMREIKIYDEQTQQIIDRFRKGPFQQVYLVDQLRIQQVLLIEEVVMNAISSILSFRTGKLQRSQNTFEIMRKFECLCFIIYMKLYFSCSFHKSLNCKIMVSQIQYQKQIQIATYFIMIGLNGKITSIFNLAVNYFDNLVDGNQYSLKKVKTILPSYLFKNLIPCLKKQFTHYITFYLLYALQRNPQEQFQIDRILCYKLLKKLIKYIDSDDKQMTYFLERLCIGTNFESIQRAYLFIILKKFMQSQFQQKKSYILQRFLDCSKQSYRLRYENSEEQFIMEINTINSCLDYNFKISQYSQEISIERYIYEQILKQTLKHRQSEVQYWNAIVQMCHFQKQKLSTLQKS